MAETAKVLVVDPRADWYVDELGARFPELELVGGRTFDEVEDVLGDTQILLTIGTAVIGAPFTPEVAAQMPALEWVQCLISGHEHVERALEGRQEITVTTTTGIHGPQVSELAILFMLGLGRELRTLMRCQDAHVWERPLPRILASKVVGIVGLGTIGSHLAPICKAFGMTVYGFTRTARSVAGVDRMFRRDELPALTPELDYLVLLVPGGEETRHLVDARLLGLDEADRLPDQPLTRLGCRRGSADRSARGPHHRRGRPRRLRGGATPGLKALCGISTTRS